MTTISSPIEFLLPPWGNSYRDDVVAKTVKRHLECRRRGGSRATNPYTEPTNDSTNMWKYSLDRDLTDMREPFHITFYEKLTDTNIKLDDKEDDQATRPTIDGQKIMIGTLYKRQDIGHTAPGIRSPSDNTTQQDFYARAFRYSAITVGHLLSLYLSSAYTWGRFLRIAQKQLTMYVHP